MGVDLKLYRSNFVPVSCNQPLKQGGNRQKLSLFFFFLFFFGFFFGGEVNCFVKCFYVAEDSRVSLGIDVCYIRTVISFSACTKIKVVFYWRSSILIGQTIFPTSEYNRLTNQWPHTIICH